MSGLLLALLFITTTTNIQAQEKDVTTTNFGAGSGEDGSNNSFFGYNSGENISTNGNYNSVFGAYTSQSLSTGLNNTLIGASAGGSISFGSHNTFTGKDAGRFNNGNNNCYYGVMAGYGATDASNNIFVGYKSASNMIQGHYNTFVGTQSGEQRVDGNYNTMLGYMSGYGSGGSNSNTFIGAFSGYSNETGVHNLFLGYETGYNNTTGKQNVFIGNGAGKNNSTGSNNIFLGISAGSNETGSNKLYIANSSTSKPLIYGDFSAGFVNFNGNVGIGTTEPQSRLDLGDHSGDIRLYDKNGTAHILGDEYSGENDGIVLRTLTNPAAGEPIFIVESSGKSQRLRVEHNGALKTSNYLEVDGTGKSYIKGSLGVGTTSPEKKLDVRGNVVLDNGSNPTIYTGRGTSELDRYLILINSPNYTTASGLKAGGVLVANDYSYASPGKNDLIVKGNVGIGTTTLPSGYKLAVNGNIIAEKVVVKVYNEWWPDFVFSKDYNLMTLNNVEEYINENFHLPGVPSANEVSESGIDLGEMNKILLQKIEELTLYIIDQEKRMEEFNSEIENMKSIINQLNK